MSGFTCFSASYPKPEAIHDAGTEVLENDVRAGDQLEKRLAPACLLEVERDGALARILREERCAHEAAVEGRGCAKLPREIAARGRLDLDDVGAELGELIAAERPRQHICEVQYANPSRSPCMISPDAPPS